MTDAPQSPVPPCCPEFARLQARLTALLDRPTGADRSRALGAFLREAAATLRHAPCDASPHRLLLLTATLQLLLWNDGDDHETQQLLHWLDTLA